MRRSEGRKEAVLEVPQGFERVRMTDPRVGDLVQMRGRKTWTTIVSFDEWYVTTQDKPDGAKKIGPRAWIVDAVRRYTPTREES